MYLQTQLRPHSTVQFEEPYNSWHTQVYAPEYLAHQVQSPELSAHRSTSPYDRQRGSPLTSRPSRGPRKDVWFAHVPPRQLQPGAPQETKPAGRGRRPATTSPPLRSSFAQAHTYARQQHSPSAVRNLQLPQYATQERKAQPTTASTNGAASSSDSSVSPPVQPTSMQSTASSGYLSEMFSTGSIMHATAPLLTLPTLCPTRDVLRRHDGKEACFYMLIADSDSGSEPRNVDYYTGEPRGKDYRPPRRDDGYADAPESDRREDKLQKVVQWERRAESPRTHVGAKREHVDMQNRGEYSESGSFKRNTPERRDRHGPSDKVREANTPNSHPSAPSRQISPPSRAASPARQALRQQAHHGEPVTPPGQPGTPSEAETLPRHPDTPSGSGTPPGQPRTPSGSGTPRENATPSASGTPPGKPHSRHPATPSRWPAVEQATARSSRGEQTPREDGEDSPTWFDSARDRRPSPACKRQANNDPYAGGGNVGSMDERPHVIARGRFEWEKPRVATGVHDGNRDSRDGAEFNSRSDRSVQACNSPYAAGVPAHERDIDLTNSGDINILLGSSGTYPRSEPDQTLRRADFTACREAVVVTASNQDGSRNDSVEVATVARAPLDSAPERGAQCAQSWPPIAVPAEEMNLMGGFFNFLSEVEGQLHDVEKVQDAQRENLMRQVKESRDEIARFGIRLASMDNGTKTKIYQVANAMSARRDATRVQNYQAEVAELRTILAETRKSRSAMLEVQAELKTVTETYRKQFAQIGAQCAKWDEEIYSLEVQSARKTTECREKRNAAIGEKIKTVSTHLGHFQRQTMHARRALLQRVAKLDHK